MGLGRHIITAFLSVAFFFGLSTFSPAVEYAWEFSGEADWNGWGGENIQFLYVKDGALVIRGSGAMRLISPEGVNVPGGTSMVRLRLKTHGAGAGAILLGSERGKRGYGKPFTLKAGPEYRDYNVYIGGVFPQHRTIERFAVDLPPSVTGEEVSIDFIRFEVPTGVEYARIWWDEFWKPDRVKGTTINFVTTPRAGPMFFPAFLYALVIIVAVAVALRSISRGSFNTDRAIRALVAGFIVGGVVFTLRMDYNWLKLWQHDYRTLGGLEVQERVPLVFEGNDEFFEFLDFLRDTVPEGASLRPAAKPPYEFFAALARYHLLPVDTSVDAEYLWVYHDPEVSFEEADGTLKKGDKTLSPPVSLVRTFEGGGGGRGAVFKIVEGGGG